LEGADFGFLQGLTFDQLSAIIKLAPAHSPLGFGPRTADTIVIFMSPYDQAGSYTLNVALPDGRLAEASFSHMTAASTATGAQQPAGQPTSSAGATSAGVQNMPQEDPGEFSRNALASCQRIGTEGAKSEDEKTWYNGNCRKSRSFPDLYCTPLPPELTAMVSQLPVQQTLCLVFAENPAAVGARCVVRNACQIPAHYLVVGEFPIIVQPSGCPPDVPCLGFLHPVGHDFCHAHQVWQTEQEKIAFTGGPSRVLKKGLVGGIDG